jgi:ribosomal protein S6--L-glutamate ligase
VRIAVIAERKEGEKSPVRRDIDRVLEERGAEVTTLFPEDAAVDVEATGPAFDLYVLKSGAVPGMSLAAVLHEAGARILNPYPAVVRMRDKVLATKALAEAGVPQPRTYLAWEPRQLAEALASGPLVVKPQRGSKGRGVTIVRTPDELLAVPADGDLFFAQDYHEPDGRDLKIYCLAGEYSGVLRVFPARTYEEKLGEPFEVADEYREIAERARRAFGVDLFGLDIILSGGRPVVVDVNTFPGFKGVPDAGVRLGEYIYEKARETSHGSEIGDQGPAVRP